MDINDAIKHAEEVAEEQLMRAGKCTGDDSLCDKYSSCMKCAEDHRQLAEWLKELKLYREIFGSIEFEHIDINFDPIDIDERIKNYEQTLGLFKNIDFGEF